MAKLLGRVATLEVSDDGGTTWTACNPGAGNHFTCDFNPNIQVLPLTQLRVVAAE